MYKSMASPLFYFKGGERVAKPVVSPIGVFDATKGTKVYFKVPTSTYGVAEFKCTISDSLNGSVVTTISKTIDINTDYNPTDGYSFEIPEESGLINRSRSYYLRLSVKLATENNSGDEAKFGDESNSVVFYCKDKPTLTFESLDADKQNPIQTSSVTFNLIYTYDVEQGEALSTYQYHLYDSSKLLLNESSVYYGNAGTNYVVYGLENETVYYVRGTGTTKNGYTLDTGYISLSVSLGYRDNRAIIRGEENSRDGTITLTSHVVSIDGETNDDVGYVNLGGGNYAVDLSDGSVVSYEIPYENSTYKTKEFDLQAIVSPIIGEEIINIKRDITDPDTGEVISTTNVIVSTHIRTITDSDGTALKFYALLKVLGAETTDSTEMKTIYIIYSNYLDCPDPDALGYVLIDVSCSGGLFGITVSKVSDRTEASA